jgi:hypothetical protein
MKFENFMSRINIPEYSKRLCIFFQFFLTSKIENYKSFTNNITNEKMPRYDGNK